MKKDYQILVVGGGTAGIMFASRMKREVKNIKIGLIEPSEKHYYQPAWTLVGANTYSFKDTERNTKDFIPSGVDWIQDYALRFDPENNQVETKDGTTYTYEFLVVCPGLQIDPSMVEGLAETLDKNNVCSNYTNPEYTWEVLKNFKGGTALFTQPTTPIKCGGAPQKIMYLAADIFKKAGISKQTNTVFATPGTVIFGVSEIRETLMKVVDRKNLGLYFGYRLVKVDGENQIAWYEMADHESYHNKKDIKIHQDGNLVGIEYDMMHLAPPQRSPDFIANSPLAAQSGWLDVDNGTLQHHTYENIFGLGDVAELPTAKTGAAIRKQVPIVVENIKRLMEHQALWSKEYNGYSSCPLVTGFGKMVLAEFDYDGNFTPDPKLKQMLIFNSAKEHWRLWMLKKYVLPYLYWNKMLRGVDV